MNKAIFENEDCKMIAETTENGLEVIVSGKNFSNSCSHAKVRISLENGVVFTEQYKPSNASAYIRKDCLAVVDTNTENVYHNTAQTAVENIPDWEKRFVLYAYDKDKGVYEPITAYNDVDHAVLRAKELAVSCTNPDIDWFEIRCENNLTVMIITLDGKTISKLKLLNKSDFPNIYTQMYFLSPAADSEPLISREKLDYILRSIETDSDTAKIITASETEYAYLIDAIANAVPEKQTVIIENKFDAIDEAIIDTIISEYKNALSDKTQTYILCFNASHANQHIAPKFNAFIRYMLADRNCIVLLRNDIDNIVDHPYGFEYIDFKKKKF